MSAGKGSTLETRQGFLAAGHFIVDFVKRIDCWPVEETLATVVDLTRSGGGGACNVLHDLVRLAPGVPLEAAGMLGDDEVGRFVRDSLSDEGIGTGQLHVTGLAPTSFTDVMTVVGTGRRTFFHHRGANALLDEGRVDPEISTARIFYLGYIGMLDGMDEQDATGSNGAARLLARAADVGMITAADLVSVQGGDLAAALAPCVPHLDILFMNEFEAARVTGCQSGALVEAARCLLSQGVRRAVIVHETRGAVAVAADGTVFNQPSLRVPQERIAGTNGAGDAFAAGFLWGVHEGWEVGRCLELAVCAAAASLADPTPSGAVLPWNECLELAKHYGFCDDCSIA